MFGFDTLMQYEFFRKRQKLEREKHEAEKAKVAEEAKRIEFSDDVFDAYKYTHSPESEKMTSMYKGKPIAKSEWDELVDAYSDRVIKSAPSSMAAAMKAHYGVGVAGAYSATTVPITKPSKRIKKSFSIDKASFNLLNEHGRRDIAVRLAHEVAMELVEEHVGMVEDAYGNTLHFEIDVVVSDA